MFRRLPVVATLVLTLLLSAVPPPASAQAAAEGLTLDEALAILQGHRIVLGDENGNLNLEANLTRAEAAALFVRSLNLAAYAAQMRDLVPFPDAAGHWGAGEIAMAHQAGLMRGDPDGNFRPEDPITYVEVLTVLLRMIQQEPAGPWSPAVVMERAQALGIAPEGAQPGDLATRQNTFWALAAALTVPLPSGQTLLRQYFDREPPELRVDPLPPATGAESVTVKGTAAGAYRVRVNGQPVAVNPETGAFTAKVDLALGPNVIRVEALDRAGNRAQASLDVVRHKPISRITIEGPAVIPPESQQAITVTAYDEDGQVVPLFDAQVSLSPSDHAFDLAEGIITTGARKGKATLTLTAGKVRATYSFEVQEPAPEAAQLQIQPLNGGRALAPGKAYAVTVRVLNGDGKVATGDYGRKVELQAEGLKRVKIEPAAAETVKGVATFTLTAEQEGEMTLVARSAGLTSARQEVLVLESPRIVLTTTAKQLAPDGSSTATIKATLMDDAGKAVNNPGPDIELVLDVDGTDGYLGQPCLTIPKGKSASTGAATFVVGYDAGTARITGEVERGPDYPVQPLAIPVDAPLAGTRFELSVSPQDPEPGDEVTVTLRVVDERGRVDTKASYAFLIRLSTSNRDRVINGIPEGVEFCFKPQGAKDPGCLDSYYRPVEGGDKDDVYAIIGRTYNGTAQIALRYHDSGVVKLTAVGVRQTREAYHPVDGFGQAAGTRGFASEPLEVQFAYKPAAIELFAVVDGDEVYDEAWVRPSRTVRVVARVLDRFGNEIPSFTGEVTLTRLAGGDRVTNIQGSNRARSEKGEATFRVYVYDGVGGDAYQASYGNLKSNTLIIRADN